METTKNLVDMGWWNNPNDSPRIDEIRKRCSMAGHLPERTGQTVENVVTCEKCGYVYRYDSSD